MSHVPILVAALGALIMTSGARAQERPDLSGSWFLRAELSGPPMPVWGQTRARGLWISQSASELRLDADGGGLSVPTGLQRFRLDGSTLEFTDDSLGDLGPWVRKVRTEARWEGARLRFLVEILTEMLDGGVPQRPAGGITSIWTLSLTGDELRIERRGFPAEPPRPLHDRLYSLANEPFYNRDIAVYARAPITSDPPIASWLRPSTNTL